MRWRQKHCDLNIPPWGLWSSRALVLLPLWLTVGSPPKLNTVTRDYIFIFVSSSCSVLLHYCSRARCSKPRTSCRFLSCSVFHQRNLGATEEREISAVIGLHLIRCPFIWKSGGPVCPVYSKACSSLLSPRCHSSHPNQNRSEPAITFIHLATGIMCSAAKRLTRKNPTRDFTKYEIYLVSHKVKVPFFPT